MGRSLVEGEESKALSTARSTLASGDRGAKMTAAKSPEVADGEGRYRVNVSIRAGRGEHLPFLFVDGGAEQKDLLCGGQPLQPEGRIAVLRGGKKAQDFRSQGEAGGEHPTPPGYFAACLHLRSLPMRLTGRSS